MPLLLGGLVSSVTTCVSVLLADIDHVWVVDDSHVELCRIFLAHLLRLESSVKVLAGQSALRARHVAADNEVRGTEILPDYHVLDRFAWSSHLHGVREICPPEEFRCH